MLEVSDISFHTTESIKSAAVVGNNLSEVILNSPMSNQTTFSPMKINFGVCVSVSKFPNIDSTLNILVIGVMTAVVVVLIVQIFRLFPDIHSIKAFMAS